MKTSTHTQLKNLTLAAMFLALGLVLPLLTGQIPQFGNMLLPMHIPVLLCGLICGWQYGGAVGFVLPLLRHLIFGMPPMPNAVSMAFELAAYGLVIGLLYFRARRRNLLSVYLSMLAAMVVGRAVWGIAQAAILGLSGFTWQMFFAGAVLRHYPAAHPHPRGDGSAGPHRARAVRPGERGAGRQAVTPRAAAQ